MSEETISHVTVYVFNYLCFVYEEIAFLFRSVYKPPGTEVKIQIISVLS